MDAGVGFVKKTRGVVHSRAAWRVVVTDRLGRYQMLLHTCVRLVVLVNINYRNGSI